MRLSLILVFLGLLLAGCLENQFDTTLLINDNDVTYLDPSQHKSEFPNDPYRIIGVTPYEDRWDIIVEYSGGCEEHQFFTHWDGLDESNYISVKKVSFTLLHNSRGDNCERLVRDTLQLNLMDIFEMDPSDEAYSLEVVNGFSGTGISVDPQLISLQQGSECGLKASLLGTTCNNGFWQNQWFLVADTIGNYEKVWVQPVKAQNTKIPANGKYEISVNLLFGYQYSQKTCDESPDGIFIPASIICVKSVD